MYSKYRVHGSRKRRKEDLEVQPPNIYIYIREGATTLFYKEENLAFSE
jgi:hypothetical protein